MQTPNIMTELIEEALDIVDADGVRTEKETRFIERMDNYGLWLQLAYSCIRAGRSPRAFIRAFPEIAEELPPAA